MSGSDRKRRRFVRKLAKENRAFYGTSDGSGVLRALDLTFEHRSTYLFELVQNALDADARSVEVRLAAQGDALIFQHDGPQPLTEADVAGLSKVFRSTKGASTVGFMGIGFKSVFRRFREARISGCGWRFRYEITDIVGAEYGDVQPDLLGTVIPVWDDGIAYPDAAFTTRFELDGKVGEAPLDEDLTRFLPDDRTLLAILSWFGLRRLTIGDQTWDLRVIETPDGGLQATASRAEIGEDEYLAWQLFDVEYEPSRDAIATFLKHRRIQPAEDDRDEVYAEAGRTRSVLGVLPLDSRSRPAPPRRGRVYALMPTGATLPFGLHVHADWFVNISRRALPDVGDSSENAWQYEIVERIADVLASHLAWLADAFQDPSAVRAAFGVFRAQDGGTGGLREVLESDRWRHRLRKRLEYACVFPVWQDGNEVAFARGRDTGVPPQQLLSAFAKQPALRPHVLLRSPVLRADLLRRDALRFFRELGSLREMSCSDLEEAWRDGLEHWWTTGPDDDEARRDLLLRVWTAIARLASVDGWREANLRCLRSASGRWLTVHEAIYLKEALPAASEPGGTVIRKAIKPLIDDDCRLVHWVPRPKGWWERDDVWNWITNNARGVGLKELVAAVVERLVTASSPDPAVPRALGHWAKHRNRHDLLTHVLVASPGTGDPRNPAERGRDEPLRLVPTADAVVAEPYVTPPVGEYVRAVFRDSLAIAAAYMEGLGARVAERHWRDFFLKAGAKGSPEVLTERRSCGRYEQDRVGEFLGVKDIGEANDAG